MEMDSTRELMTSRAEARPVADQRFTRLKTLGRELFYDNLTVPQELTNVPYGNDPSRVPEPFRQRFIPIHLLPHLWLESNPVLAQYEAQARQLRRGRTAADNISDIKKFYQKWLFELGKKDNEYFALSTINLVERNQNPANFYRFVYAATIFAYDNKFRSLPRSVEYLDQAIASLSISSLDEQARGIFNYWLRVAKGHYAYLAEDFEASYNAYDEALGFQANGITALFYKAASSAAIGRHDEVLGGIEHIVSGDLDKFYTAFEKNSVELYVYALRYAVSYQMFNETIFSPYFQEIKLLFDSMGDSSKKFLPELSKMLAKLKSLDLKQYTSYKIGEEISFLEKFCDRFLVNKNFFLIATASQLQEKYLALHKFYQDEIKKYYMNDLFAELKSYDSMIRKDEEEMIKVKEDKEKGSEILQRKHSEAVDVAEKEFDSAIAAYEQKVSDLEVSKEYDPGATFNNSMVYNVILSLVMFFIGGFVGALADRTSLSGISDSFGNLFISGIKWAGFLFILGVIVSFVSAASKVVERGNEKRRILKRINTIKNKKQTDIESMRKEYEKKVKLLGDITNARVTEIMNRIETKKNDKQNREKELREEAEQKIREEIERLNTCLM